MHIGFGGELLKILDMLCLHICPNSKIDMEQSDMNQHLYKLTI